MLPALRQATGFHANYTFLDGTPVDAIDDRNRHRGVSAWSQFAFSHFADGRGYAAFLARFFQPDSLTVEALGRLAQDALYFHEGPVEPAPQERTAYVHRMRIPVSIRKTGPWQVALSGIVDTQTPNNRFYLDRQGHVSVFHQAAGLIVTGAGSKRQPELATFSETPGNALVHMPLSSRLQMSESIDRLSLGYNTFFTDLYVSSPAEAVALRFVVSGRGRPGPDTRLNLQLCLKAGETLETGAGRRLTLGPDRVELPASELGGRIVHHGWSLEIPEGASLIWPVYPHNPYSDMPETSIAYAVGRLTVPLKLTPRPGKYVRPNEIELAFRLTAE